MKRIVPLTIAASLLVLAVGGFLLFTAIDAMRPGTAERSDVIGSWTGSRGAGLTLREDGTATGVKVPVGFRPDGTPITTAGGSGTWSMEKRKSSAADQEIKVVLDTGPDIRTGFDFSVNGQGAEDGLYLPVSAETAQQFRFKRVS
ncbi:hypothetical protein [Streptomyces monomycini]|uniref:hypothetical protein n=1 Tax=Streptomyces monomycini TaxID=371720 RepID=UPI0012FEB16C|nr:hypothetical protein [Streptomyces monomycini]